MSAFLVEKTTIDRVVTLIDHECRQSGYFKEELKQGLKIDFSNPDWRSALGQKMWHLNQLALGYRYGDAEEKLYYVYDDAPGRTSHIQLFKSLKCWPYQCSEGDIPETSKLYKCFREKMTLCLAVGIIERTEEYDEAEWA